MKDKEKLIKAENDQITKEYSRDQEKKSTKYPKNNEQNGNSKPLSINNH